MSSTFDEIAMQGMKHSWTSAPLRELCEFHNGLWKGKKGPFEVATVIRNTNFTSTGRIDLSDVAVLDVEARQLAKRRLKKNDIIIEKSGGGPKQPVGRVALFDLDSEEKYSFSNFTSAIRVARPAEVDPVYLHRVLYWWYVSGRTEPLQSHSTGIRNLDFNAYKELDVPLPSLNEQKRIVAVLDQAFAALDRARAHAEANLADADSLFDGALEEAFASNQEWPMKYLPEISENLDRQRVPITKHERQPGNVPYYGASGVVDQVAGHLFDDDLLLVSEDGANLLARTYPIAFSISGKSWVNNHAHVLRFDDSDTQEYVRLYLNSITLEPYVNGMAQPKLNQKALNQIPIPFPDEDRRAAIVAGAATIREHCNALRQHYSMQLNDLATLRQSLLQKAFSGQLA